MRVTFEACRYVAVRYEMIDGKRRRRQKTFEHTINPFNRNPDGSVKSRAEVARDVRAEALAWEDAV